MSTHGEFPRGMDVLNRQGLNKGTAFTEKERSTLGLHGLLPPQVETLDQQAVRAYEAYQRKTDDLERHIYLRALLERAQVNMTLEVFVLSLALTLVVDLV